MITVVVDRDSVAAGDDAVPHGVRETFPDDTRLGDLVVWMVEPGFLVAMRDVTWVVSLVRGGSVAQYGQYLHVADGEDVPIAALITEGDPPRWAVLPLSSSWEPRWRLDQTGLQTAAGEYLVRARYVSNGRLASFDDFRTTVGLSEADYRHRTWPQYYDEHGNRRT